MNHQGDSMKIISPPATHFMNPPKGALKVIL